MKFLIILSFFITLSYAIVDINKADKKTLETLHGIGSKKAQAILDFRKINCFKSIDALVKVKGIGLKTIQKNRTNLEATNCKK